MLKRFKKQIQGIAKYIGKQDLDAGNIIKWYYVNVSMFCGTYGVTYAEDSYGQPDYKQEILINNQCVPVAEESTEYLQVWRAIQKEYGTYE